jgi:hypothetical protein
MLVGFPAVGFMLTISEPWLCLQPGLAFLAISSSCGNNGGVEVAPNRR